MNDEGLRKGTGPDFPGSGLAAFNHAVEAMGLSVTSTEVELVRQWFLFYSRWPGRRVIGFTDPRDVAVKLLADSFAIRQVESELPVGPAIDLGSGNGWPGLALCGRAPVTLLDSRKGACDFMRAFLACAGLRGVDVVEARAEEAQKDAVLRRRFSVATSRAMASPAMALELASPFLMPGGIVALWLGPEQEAAVRAKPEISEIGLTLVREHKYSLPEGMGRRSLALYRRTGRILPGYPRKIPSIRARPLLSISSSDR